LENINSSSRLHTADRGGEHPTFFAEVNYPHPQPFSLREKGAGFKVPLPEGEGFRVRVKLKSGILPIGGRLVGTTINYRSIPDFLVSSG